MRSRMIDVWFVAATVVVLSLAFGCAGSGGGGGNAAPESGAKDSVVKTIRIEETEYTLKPAELT
jgi:hypothetical protein